MLKFKQKFKQIAIQAFEPVLRFGSKSFCLKIFVLVSLFFAIAFYPSNLNYYHQRVKNTSTHVMIIEHGLRYSLTAAQFVVPILMGDAIGFTQAIYVAAGTTIATQSLKRALNDVHSGSTRLGERPYRADSEHNMPSGHTTMAASAMFFLFLRYGRLHLCYALPLTALTMYARIALKVHTFSAIFAGCVLAAIIAAIFTSAYKSKLNSRK